MVVSASKYLLVTVIPLAKWRQCEIHLFFIETKADMTWKLMLVFAPTGRGQLSNLVFKGGLRFQ